MSIYYENWMTEDQKSCLDLMAKVLFGFHHIRGKVHPFGKGIKINTTVQTWSTHDSNSLTRLVVFAHDACIRAEIIPSGPGLIGISLHKRHSREGHMWDRHPPMEEHIKMVRPNA